MITGRLLDAALESAFAEIRITTRRLRGVALLRVAAETERLDIAENTGKEGPACMSAIGVLVEHVGGTLVADRSGGRVAWTVRLDLAGEARRSAA
jgi:hypothetical protein